MMRISLVGIILALLGLLPLVVFGTRMIGSLFKVFFSNQNGGGISRGRVTLNCPPCQQETPAGPPTCEHCGRDL